MKKTIIFLVTVLLLVMSACIQSESDTSSITKVSNDRFIVYEISSKEFQSVINNPYNNTIQHIIPKQYVAGDSFVTLRGISFCVEEELINFICDTKSLEKYLSKNGVKASVESALVIDSPEMPITVLVETKLDIYYITINENSFDKSYTYRFYCNDDFFDKFKDKEAVIIVNGEKLKCDFSIKLHHNVADLPIIAIIQALGGDIVWENDLIALIKFNNESYTINLEQRTLYNNNNSNSNLLTMVYGGVHKITPIDNDILVDSTICQNVLHIMNEDISIEFKDEYVYVNSTTQGTVSVKPEAEK